jgi:hypothetical protein
MGVVPTIQNARRNDLAEISFVHASGMVRMKATVSANESLLHRIL